MSEPALYGPAPPNLTAPPSGAETPLQCAARDGQIEFVQSHCRDTDLESVDKNGLTALHIAAQQGHIDTVQTLIKSGADVNRKRAYRYCAETALQIAAREGHLDVARLLLDSGADIEARSPGCATALDDAVYEGHTEVVRLLLERGASTEVRPEDGLNALHVLVQRDTDESTEEIMRLLFEYGVRASAEDVDERAPLYFAAQVGDVDVVRLLLENGADVNPGPMSAAIALNTAAWHGFADVVRILLDHGADMTRVNSSRRSVIYGPAQMGHLSVLSLLLERGADVAACARDGATALHVAAANARTECVQVLLRHGANVGAINKVHGTPLHAALMAPGKPSAEVVRVLLAGGASKETLNKDGLTALQLARMKHGADDVVAVLLSRHPADSSSHDGDEPLFAHTLHSAIGSAAMNPDDWYSRALAIAGRVHNAVVRFRESQLPGDLHEVIAAYERANACDPQQNFGLPALAWSYTERFRLTRDPNDIDLAIQLLRNELAVRESGLTVTYLLLELGRTLLERYNNVSHAFVDLDGAMDAFRTAMASAPPIDLNDRFEAAQAYAELCLQYRDAAASLRPYKVAINAVNGIVNPRQNIDNRYWGISQIRTTLSKAIAAAIEAGDLSLAIEWYERSRCLIWGQILRLRAPDPAGLREAASELADERELVTGNIAVKDNAYDMPDWHPSRMQRVMRYGQLVDEYNRLVEETRQLPGLETFLAPKTFDELREVADLGPVIVLNISDKRCEALIIQNRQNEVLHVPLPRLTQQLAQKIQTSFGKSLNAAGVRMRGTYIPAEPGSGSMEQTLFALWDRAVQPVLQSLGLFNSKPGAHLVRITWCVAGSFSFLPLHAARIYSEKYGPLTKACDYAAHSYTPSLSNLVDARKRSQTAMANPQNGVLAILQPATPGQAPLPGTTTEVDAIQRVVNAQGLLRLNGADATPTSVLEHIDRYSWVHFACHAVHLAAGMLTAGFQSVVATMWSIGDADAPVVMEAFYSFLVDGARGDSARSAYALHYAVKRLREQVGEKNFMRWVPFIHLGV